MKEFNGSTGAKIVINEASFKTVKKLRKCLAEELKKVQIDIGNPKSVNELKNELEKNINKWANLIKDCVLNLECSENFSAVLQELLDVCTWNNIKISDELFDDRPEAREDYDRIVFEVVKVNLKPFFKNLSGSVKQ